MKSILNRMNGYKKENIPILKVSEKDIFDELLPDISPTTNKFIERPEPPIKRREIAQMIASAMATIKLNEKPIEKMVEKAVIKEEMKEEVKEEKESEEDAVLKETIKQIEALKIENKKALETIQKLKDEIDRVKDDKGMVVFPNMVLPNQENQSGKVLGTVNNQLQWVTASGSISGSSDIYTPSNVTTLRTYDADSTSLDEIADVLGSLIASLQGIGVIQ